MIKRFLMAAGLAMLVACSGSSPTTPSDGGTSGGGGGGGGGGGTAGGNGDGGGGNSSGGGAAPLAAAVSVGNIFFKSGQNGSANAAVDTIGVGGTVTWTWKNTGTVAHSIESEGSPEFASSAIQTGDGQTYQAQFSTPGTYHYDCAVHGAAMSGTIVVK